MARKREYVTHLALMAVDHQEQRWAILRSPVTRWPDGRVKTLHTGLAESVGSFRRSRGNDVLETHRNAVHLIGDRATPEAPAFCWSNNHPKE